MERSLVRLVPWRANGTRFTGLLCLVAAAALAAGCASPAQPQAMVPAQATPVHRINGDVSLAVAGGRGTPQISDEAFAQAMTEAIDQGGVFSKVTPAGGRYTLSAFIGTLHQPSAGVSFKVSMEVSYTLIDTQSGQSVWTKAITSDYTAGFGEAFAAATRLRRATEGAARNNIQQMIAQVTALNL